MAILGEFSPVSLGKLAGRASRKLGQDKYPPVGSDGCPFSLTQKLCPDFLALVPVRILTSILSNQHMSVRLISHPSLTNASACEVFSTQTFVKFRMLGSPSVVTWNVSTRLCFLSCSSLCSLAAFRWQITFLCTVTHRLLYLRRLLPMLKKMPPLESSHTAMVLFLSFLPASLRTCGCACLGAEVAQQSLMTNSASSMKM